MIKNDDMDKLGKYIPFKDVLQQGVLTHIKRNYKT
jgi:hypothetical protein